MKMARAKINFITTVNEPGIANVYPKLNTRAWLYAMPGYLNCEFRGI